MVYNIAKNIGCSAALLLLSSVGIQAQYSQAVLKVNFNDGSHSLIEMSEDLSMDFSAEEIRFLRDKDGIRVFSLADVCKFEYCLEKASVPTIKDDTGAVVKFSAEGLCIRMTGPHICRVFNAGGAFVLSEKFDDTLFIGADSLPSGTILIQIDHNRVLKLVVR